MVGALLSSLCCPLPLAVIVLELESGAFMAVTMQYRWLLIPAGMIGVATGFILYARERLRCAARACQMAGSRITLVLLVAASLVVGTSIVLRPRTGDRGADGRRCESCRIPGVAKGNPTLRATAGGSLKISTVRR